MDKDASKSSQGPAPDASGLDAKLAPLDEFRDRAESWMKEITAQVARLAGRSEEEDRRKNALDKRLSDIEERMQSLLTITEMVSLSKNPFARPAEGSSGPATTPSPASPSPPADPAPSAEPPSAQAPAPEPADEAPVAVETPDPVEETPPQAVAAPVEPTRVEAPAPRMHPNDATGEQAMPPPAMRLPDAPAAPAPPQQIPSAPSGARGRFLVLEWARLLAPVAYRIDLGAFLGFYVEAGWVTSHTAATVRNLSLQLRHDEPARNGEHTLEELHARSIVLISQLEGRQEPVTQIQEELEEAREVAMGGWATATR